MKYRGKAHRFGDNINTDDIIPAKYLHTHDPAELDAHCMEHADKNFVKKVFQSKKLFKYMLINLIVYVIN